MRALEIPWFRDYPGRARYFQRRGIKLEPDESFGPHGRVQPIVPRRVDQIGRGNQAHSLWPCSDQNGRDCRGTRWLQEPGTIKTFSREVKWTDSLLYDVQSGLSTWYHYNPQIHHESR